MRALSNNSNLFLQFSDVLLYTNRTSGPQLQFKVHGQLPLRGVMVEESEPKMGNQFCFTIYGGNRSNTFLVSQFIRRVYLSDFDRVAYSGPF